MAKRWVEAGHNVTIVASSYSHLRTKNPGMRGQATMEEMHDGIRYFWIAGPSYQGNGLGRIKNMLSFLHGLKKYRKQIAAQGKPDAVIASSTYPLDIYPARKIAKESGALLIYEAVSYTHLSPGRRGSVRVRRSRRRR